MRQTLAVTQREMKHAERLLSSVREGVVALDKEERITFINSGCGGDPGLPRRKCAAPSLIPTSSRLRRVRRAA